MIQCHGDFQPAASRPTNKTAFAQPLDPCWTLRPRLSHAWAPSVVSMFGARDTQQVLYAAVVTSNSDLHLGLTLYFGRFFSWVWRCRISLARLLDKCLRRLERILAHPLIL